MGKVETQGLRLSKFGKKELWNLGIDGKSRDARLASQHKEPIELNSSISSLQFFRNQSFD